jgi:hypothetical protein
MMAPQDYDKEMEALKKEISGLVGASEVERILRIVDLSYIFDNNKDEISLKTEFRV